MELWAARLDRPLTEAEEERLMRSLPAERRERLERLRIREKRREPLCAYALLQRMLRERYGWESFPELALTDRGKPYFPAFPEVHFSISHTEGAVLAAVAEHPVGVDLERLRPVRRSMLDRFGAESAESFFKLWVRRESRGKCSGAGIAGMLRAEPPMQAEENYLELEVFPGYAAGVAWYGEARSVSVTQIAMETVL